LLWDLKQLQISLDTNKHKLKTKIDGLNSSQSYTIQIFANPEIIGTLFNFSTFPARMNIFFLSFLFFLIQKKKKKIQIAPKFIESTKINLTTLEISWQGSEGATRYRLVQTDLNGTLISSNDFGNITSTIVSDLESIEYIFTVYSGNDHNFDSSEGRSAIFSVDSLIFLISIFFQKKRPLNSKKKKN